MRYYHYKNNNSNVFTEERELKASGSIYTAKDKQTEPHSSRLSSKSTLIIEDDTVYEIDEECMECRK
ncbi:MAG: hypothetical protein OSJ45_04485 [Lachnospiraceae bacterium]|nr:hypothetical protein [Lachnospiraceae bacterium]